MRYKTILQNQKKQIQSQLAIKNALIKKYDIDGYISHKRIGQKTYDYLQYRDNNGEIVSVYLSDEDRNIYDRALKQRNLIQCRINDLERDLELFSGVPSVSLENCKIKLPEEFEGYRMLHGAVGVSSRFHALFHIEATENLHEYIAVATYRKRKFIMPLIYVTELNISDIPVYMSDAGRVIDNAISEAGFEVKEKNKDSLKGKTSDGVVYKASKQETGYEVSFTYRSKHYSFTVDIAYPDINDDMRRFTFSSAIKEYVRRLDMEETLRRYYEE